MKYKEIKLSYDVKVSTILNLKRFNQNIYFSNQHGSFN